MSIKDRIALQMRLRKMKNPTGMCELPTGYRVSVAWGIVVGWGLVALAVILLCAEIVSIIFWKINLWWLILPIGIVFCGIAILAKTIALINDNG